MKIEHTEIFGYRAALRGMRNPRDSWDASDSRFLSLGVGGMHTRWVDIVGQKRDGPIPSTAFDLPAVEVHKCQE